MEFVPVLDGCNTGIDSQLGHDQFIMKSVPMIGEELLHKSAWLNAYARYGMNDGTVVVAQLEPDHFYRVPRS